MKITLIAARVGILMSLLPEAARARDAGFAFDGVDMLEVPDEYAAAVTAAMADESWDVGATKLTFCARIDAAAEALRECIVTPGVGQAMEYQEAYLQAINALQAPAAATPAMYPMLAATIDIDIDPSTGKPAADVLGVARAVQVAYESWLRLGAAIRAARLAGKAAVRAAVSVEAAQAAFDAITWPALPA